MIKQSGFCTFHSILVASAVISLSVVCLSSKNLLEAFVSFRNINQKKSPIIIYSGNIISILDMQNKSVNTYLLFVILTQFIAGLATVPVMYLSIIHEIGPREPKRKMDLAYMIIFKIQVGCHIYILALSYN